MSEASADIFAVHPRALICGLCGAQRAEDVTNEGGERTIRCRGRYDGGPCPNISREGRIGKWGFIVGEYTPPPEMHVGLLTGDHRAIAELRRGRYTVEPRPFTDLRPRRSRRRTKKRNNRAGS